jgi:uracil-DNA glycosylase family protein
LDSLVQPQWSPLFRTDTQQSAVESGWYPPVEGFLFLTSGHRGAMARARATTSAANFLPAELSLPALREAAAGCKGCDLWRLGTQTVFGEGPESAGVMFVGEQPGDQEDRAGKPFVGPAGRLLDKALAEAGIDRSATYLTNAVKHFKWQARGKRRIHQKPTWAEITACRPWLEAELTVVHPRVLVLLGATAAQSLLGREFRVRQNRGSLVESDLAGAVTATIHPSAILRGEPEQRETEFSAFVDDLRFVAGLL